jgi:integrase
MGSRLLRTKEVDNAPIGQRLNDGAGLRGIKRQGGVVWSWRGTLYGKQIEVGLGKLSLADARRRALDKEELVEQGIDPRVATKTEQAVITSSGITLGQYFEDWFNNKKKVELTSEKDQRNWGNALYNHLPGLMQTPIDQIDLQMAASALRGIWLDKPEAADRVRNKAKQVMVSAIALGLYEKANPFDKELLMTQLPNVKHKVAHHAAIPFTFAPELYAKLLKSKSNSATALRCLMLTATRSNEGRGMAFGEIDGNDWHIPEERMKGNLAFTQVLSQPVLDIVSDMPARTERVFAGAGGKVPYVSCTAVRKQVKKHAGEFTVHGMRSAFKDWCAGNGVDDLVSEIALSHQDRDKVRAAYLRSDFIDERRRLMDDWSRYLLGYSS